MADKTTKGSTPKRQLKKTETVRERSDRSSALAPKKQRISKSARVVARPFKAAGKKIVKIVSPLSFMLAPFKTRPARAIGRVLAGVLLLRFFRDSWTELRQVQWPNARETTRLSIAVFVFSIAFGIIISITDYGLGKIFKKLFID